MYASRHALVAVLLASGAARAAGADFADDFESGQLLKADGGAWDGYAQTRAGVTLSANAAAAHRGGFGLRVFDTDSATASGNGTSMTRAFATGVSGTVHLRFWVRFTPDMSSGPGTLFLGGVVSGIGASATASQVSMIVDGFDATNTYYRYNAGMLATAEWHLIEVTQTGLGATGTDRMRIDGQSVLSSPTIDRSSTSATSVTVGENYADNSNFTGTIDFDDLRTSSAPMASALSVAPEVAAAHVGDCVPLTVQLLDFDDGGVAPAPYELFAAMSADGGTFHGDVSCSTVTQMSSATFSAGATQSRPIWFRPRATGQLVLSVQHVDFLPGSAALDVAAMQTVDSGTDDDAGAADAGAPDAGALDAGEGADAGGPMDAGHHDDAGAPDSGMAADGGSIEPPPPASGCGCGEASLGPLAALAALWLTASSTARRRAAKRHRRA